MNKHEIIKFKKNIFLYQIKNINYLILNNEISLFKIKII